MDFNGPEPADLAEVQSLNIAFLEYLRAAPDGQLLQQLPTSLRPAVVALTDRQVQRLAAVPFLLLTMRESDHAYWARLFGDRPMGDLFACAPVVVDELGRITSATLGFVWQLSRRNPYATRLVCGGSLDWCEQLAACTLLRLLQRAVDHQDLIGVRYAGSIEFWHRLLGAGLSSEVGVRRAAHLCALQTVLTSRELTSGSRLRAAACHSAVPTLSVRKRSIRPEDEST
ncbi:MAG: hypothetical protein IIA12_00295 [Proteobacteria bacterium]|nr:hypothetical protein [Pseudomonadota bacterium]